jgi:hypothetical protein
MLLRRTSSSLLAASKLVLPAVALGIAAIIVGRRVRAEAAAPRMPRLPVRRKVASPSSSRLRRLSAPAPAVAPPGAFWDAMTEDEDGDDPAEIPDHASALVSEASLSAAGIAPGAFHDSIVQLRW